MPGGMSGVLAADFASFFEACQKAEVSLTSFETGGSKVEKQLNRTTDAFSGKKIIQDATLAAQAVENIGGASFLTESELQRLGAQADEAIEKMIRMGVDVPPGIKSIADAAREAAGETEKLGGVAAGATPKATGLGGSLRSVDGSLRAVGVNIGPLIPLVDELGAASGKSATALGGLGTAAAVAAAAVGGWKIGRVISEFFDLDTKIGNATAKLLGWGDVAGQEAAVGADVLARATTNAGRQITNMSEAVEINRIATEKSIASTAVALKTTTFDIGKMREEMLKTEAARVIGPDVTPSVVALGRATIETTRNLSAMEAKLQSVERLNESITSRLQALQNDLDREQRERDAQRYAGLAGNATASTRDIIGQITPLSGRDATNPAALQAMIAQLSRDIAEFKLPTYNAPGGVGSSIASNQILAAAQQNADNIRQLAYLQQLLGLAPARGSVAPLLASTPIGPAFGQGSSGVTVHVNVSGVWDPASARKIGDVVGTELMERLRLGRQLGG